MVQVLHDLDSHIMKALKATKEENAYFDRLLMLAVPTKNTNYSDMEGNEDEIEGYLKDLQSMYNY